MHWTQVTSRWLQGALGGEAGSKVPEAESTVNTPVTRRGRLSRRSFGSTHNTHHRGLFRSSSQHCSSPTWLVQPTSPRRNTIRKLPRGILTFAFGQDVHWSDAVEANLATPLPTARSSSHRACAAVRPCRKRNRNLHDQFDRRAEAQLEREPRSSWIQTCRRNFLGMPEDGGRAGDLRDPARSVLQRVSVAGDRDRGGMDIGSGDKCPMTEPAGNSLGRLDVRLGWGEKVELSCLVLQTSTRAPSVLRSQNLR